MGTASTTGLAFFQWIRKLLIVGFVFFLFAFTLIIFGIQIPLIQKKLVDFGTVKLSKLVDYPIKIEGVKITFTGGLILENVTIEDGRRLDMITVKQVRASFKLISLFGRDIILQKITLKDANVKLRYYPEVHDVNLSDFIYRLQHIGEDYTEKNKPKPIHNGRYVNFIVKIVDLENAKFSFQDVDKEHVNDRFDFSKFALDSIFMSVSKFKIVADTISFNIKDLTCIDEFSKLKVHKLDADFGICEHYMKLQNLNADLGSSHIANSIIFNYKGFKQLSHIADSVLLDLGIEKSRLNTKDVAVFFPELKALNDRWLVSGKLKGFFHDFEVEDFDLLFGENSRAEGNAAFKGLPNIYNTDFKIEIGESTIWPADIKKYGLAENFSAIKPFGKSYIIGVFEGRYHNFHFDGSAITKLGGINADFRMQFDENNILGTAKYKGVLALQNFDLKPYGTPDWLQRISFNLKIDGNGFEPKTGNINASGFVNRVNLAGYDYKNTFISLRYADQKGQASLDIQDSNLVMDVLLKGDFRQKEQKVDLDAHILKANINKLGYYNTPLTIATDFQFSSVKFNKEHFCFNLEGSDFTLSTNKSNANLRKFAISYDKKKNGERLLNMVSDAIDMKIDGSFELFSLKTVLDSLRNNISHSFDGGRNVSQRYSYQNKTVDADIAIVLRKINPFLAIFVPELKLSEFANFRGHLNTKKGLSLGVQANLDSILWQNILLVSNKFTLNLEKSNDAAPIFASLEANSFNQFVDNEPITENLSINSNWKDNVISFETLVKQQNEPNSAHLIGNLTVGSAEKQLSFKKFELNILDNKWNIDEGNKMSLKPAFIVFNQFDMRSDTQLVSLQGELSRSPESKLSLTMKSFRMQNLEKVFNKKLEGTIEGFLSVENYFTEPKINSTLKANNLKINKLFIGNILGEANWDNQNKKIDLNLEVERLGNKMFSLHGNYAPNLQKREERLNIVAILNKTNLVIFEPFIKDILSNIEGDATGLITLRGSLSKPIINGEIDVDGGAFKVNYLNTTYFFNDKIAMNPTGFVLNNIVLDDRKGGLAVVEGGIYHTNFKDFRIRIDGEYKNIELLNTTAKDNEIYYGDAIATGNFSLNGNFSELDINLKAIAQKGTKLSIIYNSASNTEGQSFIRFVSPKPRKNGPQQTNKTSKATNFKVTANLEIDITDDAFAEFVLDRNTGDKIAGYGDGKIKLFFNTDGDFTMNGNYTFSRDSYYLFTFLNVINKKFTIQKGSRVEWNGDPSAGILDVTARYEDRIPLYPLVDSVYWSRSGIRTPYPVATILYVKGEILKPEISYDIKIYNYPAAIADVPLFSYISAFENKIKNNVNEMNTQVFSLLVFRRFLYGTSGLEGAAGSTVSELLTNQLSQIVSELDKNLQVDLRMNGLDRAALNAVQVRISYELLDGKVRITRSGGVTNSQSQATTSSIIGDISIEYMLTNDGRFRLKGFTRQNPNSLSISSGSQGNSSTGASLLHTTSFDSLNPFDKKKKKKYAQKTLNKTTPKPNAN
ncbi:MAG: translocation/assembly module TamB domain-containing protein [Cytophagales bacterium]